MQDLIILTCGGTGREIREVAKDSFNVLGFLDDCKVGPEILGTLQDIEKFKGRAKLCSGLGNYRKMNRRLAILETIDLNYFANVFARDSRVYSDAALGIGILVFPFAVISSGATIGNHVLIYHSCVVAHDTAVGDFSILANAVTLSGQVTIGTNCYIGAGATVLEGISIGDNSIIAAGATVVKSVASNTIYISKDDSRPNRYHS